MFADCHHLQDVETRKRALCRDRDLRSKLIPGRRWLPSFYLLCVSAANLRLPIVLQDRK